MKEQGYKKQESIDDVLGYVGKMSQMLEQGDYVGALFVADNFSGNYKTDALYAGIGMELSKQLEGAKDEQVMELGNMLLNYCKSKCSYMNQQE